MRILEQKIPDEERANSQSKAGWRQSDIGAHGMRGEAYVDTINRIDERQNSQRNDEPADHLRAHRAERVSSADAHIRAFTGDVLPMNVSMKTGSLRLGATIFYAPATPCIAVADPVNMFYKLNQCEFPGDVGWPLAR